MGFLAKPAFGAAAALWTMLEAPLSPKAEVAETLKVAMTRTEVSFILISRSYLMVVRRLLLVMTNGQCEKIRDGRKRSFERADKNSRFDKKICTSTCFEPDSIRNPNLAPFSCLHNLKDSRYGLSGNDVIVVSRRIFI